MRDKLEDVKTKEKVGICNFICSSTQLQVIKDAEDAEALIKSVKDLLRV